MTEWFRESFREQYLWRYSHRDQDEARTTVDLIGGVTGLAHGASVLDAPCGAGRHAREFAARGFVTTALDLRAELIAIARRSHADSRAAYLRADLRAIPARSAAFDLVANLFSSFGYMETDTENAGVLRELARVCRPGGWVIVDFLNEPQLRASLQPSSERTLPQGWHVAERRLIAGRPPRVVKHTTLAHLDGTRHDIVESVRLYTPGELQAAMAAAGCNVEHVFGDYHGAAHTERAPRCILFGRRRR